LRESPRPLSRIITERLFMEPTLDRVIVGRFRRGLLLVLVLGVVLVGFIPFAAGDSDRLVNASMHVSTPEASPGDQVTFWISVHPLDDDALNLVVTEVLPEGLAIVSTSAPGSCENRNLTWACTQEDGEALAIEVRVVVKPGTEGQELDNVARIEIQGHRGEPDVVTVHAGLLIVPSRLVEKPNLQVRVSASQDAIVPNSELNYRIEVTNNGTAAAANLSVVVSMPVAMVLLSASPLPVSREGELRWTVDSMPVRSLVFLFNTSLPPADGLTQAQVAVAVTYGDGQGGEVRVEGLPSSLRVIPVAGEAPGPAVPVGLIVAVVAFIGGGLLVAQHTVGLPLLGRSGAEEIFLLHRSGLVLRHFSAHPSPGADSDIVGGMMAAVRMFVEDSMSPYAGHLREIRFGGGSIVFVNGENVSLAAVNARGGTARFADRAMRFLREFERMNGAALMNFDGVAGGLEGIDALFRRFARRPGVIPGPRLERPTGDVPRQ